jgi:hypothetical protein
MLGQIDSGARAAGIACVKANYLLGCGALQYDRMQYPHTFVIEQTKPDLTPLISRALNQLTLNQTEKSFCIFFQKEAFDLFAFFLKKRPTC